MGEFSERWSEVEISGKRADVFEPAQPARNGHVVLHLHGYEQETLRSSRPFSAELDRHGLRAICPHGEGCWWTESICRDFDPAVSPLGFIRENVGRYIREHWMMQAPHVAVTGIGFGGQGALQLAYRYPNEFPVVAAISPAIDFHNWYGRGLTLDEMFANREAARQQTATLHVRPLNWPRHQLIVCDPLDGEWMESCERLTSKLFSSGIPFEADLKTTGGGHCWEYFETMAKPVMQFIAGRLNQELLRLDARYGN